MLDKDSPTGYQTHRQWWTVEDAAKVLRVNIHTLYRACAADDFPHQRVAGLIKIPCSALRMTYVPTAAESRMLGEYAQVTGSGYDPEQLALPLDPSCLIPVKRYRTGERVPVWAYEQALWRVRK